MPDFLLKKWYLDYITPEYDAAIFYKGSLRFGPVEIHHCSELRKSGNTITNNVFWDNKKFSITESGHQIRCQSPEDEIVWDPLEEAIHFPMFEKEDKYIRWHCVQPRANVTVVGKHGNFSGHGYIEKLETNILPWEFDFDSLLWGRFIGEYTSVIWTSMRGNFSRDVVWINGQKMQDCSISEAEIIFPGGRLSIQNGIILREGNLINTVLSAMPFLKQVLPKTGLPLHERKSLAKGTLFVDGISEDGKIIHENVQWK